VSWVGLVTKVHCRIASQPRDAQNSMMRIVHMGDSCADGCRLNMFGDIKLAV
jgi:hypothetical protein